jgi:hypothetical protein
VRHELHLARAGFAGLAAVAVVSAALGAAFAGSRGATSALVGVALIAGNHALAVASTGWARTINPTVIAVGYGAFVMRLMLLLTAFIVLSSVAWVHGPILAWTFCASLVVSLTAECIAFARGSYIPAWRTR